ncbi:MAG: molybdate ABC transporter substrate-binding protein [Cyanobacteria bacterium]|jgi:molybdate transport system substrate-binding protein|nr:molybdate ABC transporter substrate-binding protein [Cyanobacteria bacterium GSL.Bin1]
MKNRKISSFLSLGIVSLLFLTGCESPETSQLENSSQETTANQLTVSAAASLQDVMKAIKPLYEEAYPDREIVYNFASSGSLQRQIEQGAPVDVFISAAVDKMDALAEKDLIITETRRDLLKNQMVLVIQEGNKARINITDFEDLNTEKVNLIALGEPESVPAGRYAQDVLNSFNIADKVNAKAVYGKDVRQVLNYVATGNVEAGIVYRTDAQVSDNVEIIATAPEESHSPVIYPIAVIKDSDTPETSKELIQFLTTEEAQVVFEDYGFVPVTNNQ